MVGNAPSYFGEGKGANFLSDIKRIRRNFNITLEKSNRNDYYLLKLLPGKKSFDLSVIYLSISKKTFDVVQIVTLNAYEDENKIKLSNFQFKENLSDLMFSFKPPENTEILNLED
jgi:outer membrane lipoprotein carrier protein